MILDPSGLVIENKMVEDPSREFILNQNVTHVPGLVEIHYTPQSKGLHWVVVTVNGQGIQGDQTVVS